MRNRLGLPETMRLMRTNWYWWMKEARQLPLPGLVLAAALCLALASLLSGCVNVAGFTQPTLIRVIDASYTAPAIDVVVEGQVLAGNIGQGTISPYGTLMASTAAPIKIAAANGGSSLTTTSAALLAGHQYSVFLTDDSTTPSGYTVSLLADQQIAAPVGHSSFRFLNQAINTGPVDIYMIPSGSTLAKSVPLVANLPVGTSGNYINFTSQTVTMVITPAGSTTPRYTSTAMALYGGEVRTVLLVDAQLTSKPPVQVFIANDVN